MSREYLTLRMRCVLCAFEFDFEVEVTEEARRQSRMADCPTCQSHTAEPTVRPYSLTADDRKFLRGLRVQITDRALA